MTEDEAIPLFLRAAHTDLSCDEPYQSSRSEWRQRHRRCVITIVSRLDRLASVNDYFMLLLYIITGSNSNFIKHLLTLPLKQPSDLTLLTDNDWATIFQQNPMWLPAFTSPGSTAQRTAAFITFFASFSPWVSLNPLQPHQPAPHRHLVLI